MHPLSALILFLGSYFPLTLILFIQDIKETSWKAPLCTLAEISTCHMPELSNPERVLGLLVICALSLTIFMWLMRNLTRFSTLEVLESKSIPNDLINYVFPYVVSFMGLDLGVDGKFFGFLLFIGLMFLITYRSGQILMNPILLIAGWQLYELNVVIEGHRRSVRALSNVPICVGDRLESCLVHGIYVLHRSENDNY